MLTGSSSLNSVDIYARGKIFTFRKSYSLEQVVSVSGPKYNFQPSCNYNNILFLFLLIILILLSLTILEVSHVGVGYCVIIFAGKGTYRGL